MDYSHIRSTLRTNLYHTLSKTSEVDTVHKLLQSLVFVETLDILDRVFYDDLLANLDRASRALEDIAESIKDR